MPTPRVSIARKPTIAAKVKISESKTCTMKLRFSRSPYAMLVAVISADIADRALQRATITPRAAATVNVP